MLERRKHMENSTYEAPVLVTLGTVSDLTKSGGIVGNSDSYPGSVNPAGLS